MTIDGRFLQGTGTEDYFDAAFYFVGSPHGTPFAQWANKLESATGESASATAGGATGDGGTRGEIAGYGGSVEPGTGGGVLEGGSPTGGRVASGGSAGAVVGDGGSLAAPNFSLGELPRMSP